MRKEGGGGKETGRERKYQCSVAKTDRVLSTFYHCDKYDCKCSGVCGGDSVMWCLHTNNLHIILQCSAHDAIIIWYHSNGMVTAHSLQTDQLSNLQTLLSAAAHSQLGAGEMCTLKSAAPNACTF